MLSLAGLVSGPVSFFCVQSGRLPGGDDRGALCNLRGRCLLLPFPTLPGRAVVPGPAGRLPNISPSRGVDRGQAGRAFVSVCRDEMHFSLSVGREKETSFVVSTLLSPGRKL